MTSHFGNKFAQVDDRKLGVAEYVARTAGVGLFKTLVALMLIPCAIIVLVLYGLSFAWMRR